MAGRKQFEIGIDDTTLNEIFNAIEEVGEKEIKGILKSDSLQIHKIAANFLQVALEVQNKINEIENMMYAQKKLRKQIMNELGVTGKFLSQYETDAYRANRERLNEDLKGMEVEKLYEASFKFHEEINKILGQKVVTIIELPGENGEPLLFPLTKDQIFDNNILSYEQTSKTARLAARFRTSAEQMRKAGIESLSKDQIGNNNLNVEGLNQTYKTVLHRYDKYDRLVLWLYPNSVWNWMRVSARGDIAEAYAAFFLIQTEYNFADEENKNINVFMRQGVANVDNISGLLQGDIQSVDGSIQYAIKSLDASYMSITQMITLAKNILQKQDYSVEDLKKYKAKLAEKKSRIRNEVKSSLTHQCTKDIQSAIDSIKQT